MSDIPVGYCQCGCGQKTQLARQNHTKQGWIKGRPLRFLPGHHKMQPTEERFWSQVDKRGPDECWIWTGSPVGNGYGYFTMGRGHRVYAHRFSYERANGPVPSGLDVLHKCDNPPCVNPNHLYAGTPTENVRDCREHNRLNPPRGSRSGTARLTEELVIEIRHAHECGQSSASLARQYGVGESTIGNIVNRKTWNHI